MRYVDPDEDILFNSDFDNWVNVHEYAPHLLENDRARASTLRLPSIMSGVRDFSVDVDRALSFYAANNADRHSIRYSAGLLVTDIIFAEICYERENFEQAEEVIKRIMPVIVSEKYTEFYFSCIVLLVKIVRAIHDSKEVEKLTARLKTQIHDNEHLFLLPNFHAFELRNHLADGMSEVIEEFEKKYKPHKDRPYYYMIYRNITYVRALISEKRYNEAAITLGNLEYMLHQYKRNFDLIEVSILRSVAEHGLGNETNAYCYLQAALDRGRQGGFIRIFSDDAALIWPILNLINKREIDEYIKKIVVSCKRALVRLGISTQADNNTHMPLTRAEQQILRLLPTNMSYQDIADARQVKISTVRTHMHAIYQKLGVNTRYSAVFTAEKLGLLQPR